MLFKSINPHLSLLAAAAALLCPVSFADPLAANTMVVYVSNSPDSITVKNHYMAARSITNSCALTLPDITTARLSLNEYNTLIRNPIRNCLTSVGAANIYYIVLAYVRPYAIDGPSYAYAVDSYLADIWDQYSTQNFYPVPAAPHRYFAPDQAQGNFHLPFTSLQAFRATPRATQIYSVWRLDGATKEIAMGLVDKATAAMNNLTGAICIDRNRGDINFVADNRYGAGDWDLHRAGVIFGQSGFTITEDPIESEFGSGLAPAKCPVDGSPVAFFSGWYSYNNYNGVGVFNFTPGAIGLHLDSAAALDPRSGSNWTANALQNGVTVTAGAMMEPYLEGIPRPAGLAWNLLEGANVGDAFLRNTRWIKWTQLFIGDPLYRPFPSTGLPAYNAIGAQPSLYLSNREVVGSVGATGTVTLASDAPTGGTTVSLSSTVPAVVSLPETVTVPAGERSVSFPISTTAVADTNLPFITATFGSTTLQNTLAVNPILAAVGLSASTVSAGASIVGGVQFNAAAPPGGASVALLSTDSSLAVVPATVTVPAGLARANFPISTSAVTSSKSLKIKATYAGKTQEVTLNLVPAFITAGFDQPTVNSNGFDVFSVKLATPAPAGGAAVALSISNPALVSLPTQLVVSAGQTYAQVGFSVGAGPATVTVTATYGGDSRTVTLTIN